jgi:hypothetical protein
MPPAKKATVPVSRVILAGGPFAPPAPIGNMLASVGFSSNGAERIFTIVGELVDLSDVCSALDRDQKLQAVIVYVSPSEASATCIKRGESVQIGLGAWRQFAVAATAAFRAKRPRVTLLELGSADAVAEAVAKLVGVDAIHLPRFALQPDALSRFLAPTHTPEDDDLSEIYAELQACSATTPREDAGLGQTAMRAAAIDELNTMRQDIENLRVEKVSLLSENATLQDDKVVLLHERDQLAARIDQLAQKVAAANSVVEAAKVDARLKVEAATRARIAELEETMKASSEGEGASQDMLEYVDLLEAQVALLQDTLDAPNAPQRHEMDHVLRDAPLGTGLSEETDLSDWPTTAMAVSRKESTQ